MEGELCVTTLITAIKETNSRVKCYLTNNQGSPHGEKTTIFPLDKFL